MAEYIDKETAIQICIDSWDTCDAGQDIKDEPPAKVISLDRIKEAREEIENLSLNDYGDNLYQLQAKCSEILSKLIESEKLEKRKE